MWLYIDSLVCVRPYVEDDCDTQYNDAALGGFDMMMALVLYNG